MDDKVKNIKIETSNAPAAIGPYSQAIQSGNFVYVSGQLPLNPKTGEMVSDAIKEQTAQVLKNMKAVLEEAGCGFKNVVKTEVFLKDMADFAGMNEVYSEFFTDDPKPARQAIEAARLPKDALVEISCIAILWDFL